MPIQILMPALSPTMTEGAIVRWLKAEGDQIKSGDLLAEIETDKATMELEAVDEGVLGKILYQEGSEGVEVNKPIALLLEEGEEASTLEDSDMGVEQVSTLDKTSSKEVDLEVPGEAQSEVNVTSIEDTTEQSNKSTELAANTKEEERVFASPLAKRISVDHGIELDKIVGTGPSGRIVKADLDKFITLESSSTSGMLTELKTAEEISVKSPDLPVSLPDIDEEQYTEIPHTKMRRVIAERLTAAARDIPHFFLTADCNVKQLIDLREDINKKSKPGDNSYKISVNDFLVAAVAIAMRKIPMVNVSWTEDAIRQNLNIDVAIAVSTNGGLITPIIRKADQLGLIEISRVSKDLVKRARDGNLAPQEYQGGGFTISNLGMYGVKQFSAIINPPQSCILAVGTAEERPTVLDGILSVSTMMSCTLSVDHRSVDGALGAEFLDCFKSLVEDPISMIL